MIHVPKQLWHVLLPVFLAGCAAPAPQDTRTYSIIEETLRESAQANLKQVENTPPPAQISSALLPKIQLNLPDKVHVEYEPRFDLKVDRVNAREFFMGLVGGTPSNMVVHPKVKGRITLDLKNVSVAEVMDVTRDIYGFDFERTATAYHVFPDEIRTRIFNLNYLAVKRSGSSNVRVSSGQVTQGQGNRFNNSNSTSSSNFNNNSPRSGRSTLPSSSIDTTSESDFWAELRSSLDAIVGNAEGRSVVVSAQSGVIVVRAMPDELRAIDRYLKNTESVMHRQVILEAKVVEVVLADGFQSGINWSALKENGSSSALLGQTGGGSIFNSSDGTSIISGSTGNLNPGAVQPINGTAASAFGGVFTAMLNVSSNFTAFIELLKSQGDVQVLSSPQVSTMNNQKAVIKVGTDKFFITDVQTNTNTSSLATSNIQNNVELTPFFSGVSLDVIPQISETNDITLHIHPTVVDVEEEVKSISVSDETTLSVPLAVSTVRESDTVIRARNGQVVIIGGLMKNKTSDKVSSIPFFGDLPLVGGLFRHTKELMVKSELVILLKPTVVEGPQQWAQGIQRSHDRIRGMTKRPVAAEAN